MSFKINKYFINALTRCPKTSENEIFENWSRKQTAMSVNAFEIQYILYQSTKYMPSNAIY